MISCREYVKNKKKEIKDWIVECTNKYGYKPSLCVIQVGDNPASNSYIKGKEKDCDEVGIRFKHIKYEENIKQSALMENIKAISLSGEFDGIIVQLPLPSHLDVDEITNCIPANMDVDGFRPDSAFYPCTPKGIIDWLDYNKYTLEGKEFVVIGRSKIVGKPLVNMLIDRGATVTCCNSKTKYLWNHTQYADVVVSAIGKPKFFESTYFDDAEIVIDVGVNRDENGKLCGDVDIDDVHNYNQAIYVTPVPGGVGLLTRVALLENVVAAYELNVMEE